MDNKEKTSSSCEVLVLFTREHGMWVAHIPVDSVYFSEYVVAAPGDWIPWLELAVIDTQAEQKILSASELQEPSDFTSPPGCKQPGFEPSEMNLRSSIHDFLKSEEFRLIRKPSPFAAPNHAIKAGLEVFSIREYVVAIEVVRDSLPTDLLVPCHHSSWHPWVNAELLKGKLYRIHAWDTNLSGEPFLKKGASSLVFFSEDGYLRIGFSDIPKFFKDLK